MSTSKVGVDAVLDIFGLPAGAVRGLGDSGVQPAVLKLVEALRPQFDMPTWSGVGITLREAP